MMKRTEENLIVCSCKSEAELALNVSYYWSYWQTRSSAQSLGDSRAISENHMILGSLVLMHSSSSHIRDVDVMDLCQWLYDATFCCWQPLDVELHYTQCRTYGLKAQVIKGVLTGFVTGIHKDSVHRWNLWFPSAGVFAEVLAGRVTGMQITFLFTLFRMYNVVVVFQCPSV